MTLSMLFVSWVPRWFLYEPLFHYHHRRRAKQNQSSIAACSNDEQIISAQKFSQSLAAASFHIGMSILAYRVLRHKPWVWQMNEWKSPHRVVEMDVKAYYLLYAARYMSDAISLCFEHVRSVSCASVVACMKYLYGAMIKPTTSSNAILSLTIYVVYSHMFAGYCTYLLIGYLGICCPPRCDDWTRFALGMFGMPPYWECHHVLF